MKLHYLGTAAAEGWPAVFCRCRICQAARRAGGRNLRTRTQTLIDDRLLIDWPPDTYSHALTYGLALDTVRHLFVTHSHMDHFFPTELIHRHEHFAPTAAGCLRVYGNCTVEEAFRAAVSLDRFRDHPLDGAVEFCPIEPYETVEADGYRVTAIPADHDPREVCYIYLIEKDGRCVLYGHDTGLDMSEEAWRRLYDRRYALVTLDCTMGKNSIGGRYHMGVNDVLTFLERLDEHGCLAPDTVRVINHFSHNGEMDHAQLDAWASAHGMLCAYDGMEVTI